jgi:PAS domain S-box-containing protein
MGEDPTATGSEEGARVSLAEQSNAFFRQVVDGMRCGILTVDREGRLLTLNELAREILELEQEAPCGRPLREVLRRHPRLTDVLLDSLEMSQMPNRSEMEIRTRGDDGRTIGFTISPIVDEGEKKGVALFFKDLTQVEQQEEQERLRDRLAALGQMAASLAHEIRNPLASIDVMTSLLKRRLADHGEEIDLVEKIAGEVARLNRTVTQGLEFARPISPDRREQDVAPVLDQALQEVQNHFPEVRVDVVRDYDPHTPRVPLDAGLLRPVLVNLILNAFEALEGQGRLTLRVRQGPEGAPRARWAEIEIADDGPGIPADVLEKIFYPFVTTKESGSGIGLAMARKVVECHHGLIDVTTQPGDGTTFRLRLPRQAETVDGRMDAQDSRG